MHRALLRTVGTAVALATSVVLAGCGAPAGPGASTPPAPAASTAPVPPTTVDGVAPGTLVMVIRHAEKPDDDSGPGIDANGNEDESSLTEQGWDRARRLVDLFTTAPGVSQPGPVRPRAIYAAGANDEGRGARTRETVLPLATELGIPLDTRFGKGDEEELVEHVIAQPGPTLISWQHSGIPTIAEAFPGVTPEPPSEWPDDRFDVIWTLTRTADGWHFAQSPELVLPHDSAEIIED